MDLATNEAKAPQRLTPIPSSQYPHLDINTMDMNARPRGYFGKGTVEVAPPERPGEGGIRRLEVEKDALVTEPVPGVSTISDIIDYAAREHGQKNAVGWRDIINVHEEKKEIKKVVDGQEKTETKTWKYFELSDYRFMDYVQFKEAISEVARALLDLGIESDDVVDIFAQTSPSWQLISHACALISTTAATAYDTLGESGLAHSLNEPKCVAIFTNSDLLPTVAKVLPTCPSVKFVFYDGEPDNSILDKIQAIRKTNTTSYAAAASGSQTHSIRAIHIDQLRSIGRDLPLSILNSRRPTRDTTACIMYTSGSTGNPKGVVLTHGNLVAAVAAVNSVFGPHLPPGGRYIAYLPLAHVLEYVVELCAVFVGITCGYARPKTLTDESTRNCVGDLRALRPNVMFGVPAVWETIRKAVVSKVNSGGFLVRNAFNLALGVKRYIGGWVPGVNWAIDSVVLARIKEAVGGDIHFAVNGGAGISRDTQEFFNLAVMPLTQGYGLTETCGMGAFLPPELLSPASFGSVGVPGPCLEIKLVDCPDMGYFSDPKSQHNAERSGAASTSTSSHLPQGEICLRGASLTKGYFNRPDLNEDEETFTKDGWFRTGDIGQWNEDGTLSLIDRKKNLVKLKGGEYIALERLEAIYKSSDFVSNLCLYASSDMSQPLAIVVPHEKNLRAAVRTSTSDLQQLCSEKAARKAVFDDLTQLAKRNGFSRMETPSDVILTAQEWTSKNGMVTAAGKVNRGKTMTAITQNLPWFVRDLGVSVIGEECYTSLVANLDISDVKCLKYSLSKGLGVGIVLGGSIMKVPQVILIARAKSARGLSLSSYVLETTAYAITLFYSMRNHFPFSTYGENFFLTQQNIIITLLIVYYAPTRQSKSQALLLSTLLVLVGLAILYYVPMLLLSFLQMSTLPLSLISKVPQIRQNYRSKSTGQLSSFAVLSQIVGCLARLYTTATELNDPLVSAGFLLALILNTVLGVQLWIYRNDHYKSDMFAEPELKEIHVSNEFWSGIIADRPSVPAPISSMYHSPTSTVQPMPISPPPSKWTRKVD
ncbi:hypothetical protein CVT26_006355 [Gymnopilus dilepis]|uniref:AMP-dependent synthetase/ligase domain-containing protein n=1 Tax=Gymnopilus dilepis TaxID=231916 RepID=A0A409W653_9AGAR|nr:hypothetical protein CVT26_006355 [Gymnopilus dilepis]